MSSKKTRGRLEILTGWKEIASYLRMGVRSVQRYERELSLPIHRLNGKSTGSVIATKAELDSWVTARLRSRLKRFPAEQMHRIGAQFLQIDSEIALTFSGLALEERVEEKKGRRIQSARRAYDTIMKLRKNIVLTDAERTKLDANLQRLKSELESLGETF